MLFTANKTKFPFWHSTDNRKTSLTNLPKTTDKQINLSTTNNFSLGLHYTSNTTQPCQHISTKQIHRRMDLTHRINSAILLLLQVKQKQIENLFPTLPPTSLVRFNTDNCV